jgi:hypothetical protein
MNRTFRIRPYIGHENLSIDGRMIPYPLVTAGEYLKAKHEDMTDQDLDEFIDNRLEQYSMLNTIIAMKQSCFLLRHTRYSCDSLADHLYDHKNDMVSKYNETYPDEPFDEGFYDNYSKYISVVHDNLGKIDFSYMTEPVCVIYEHPLDYPDKYVVRIMDVCSGDVQITNAIILRDTVAECREEIHNNGFFYCVPPVFEDDKCIVETWTR